MRSRPVWARAIRIAVIAASVPDEVIRTIRASGIRRPTSSASSTSPGVGAPKLVPPAAALAIAASTAGCAWPATSAPHEQT